MEVYDTIPDIWSIILFKINNIRDIVNIYEIFNGSKIILNNTSFWINRFKKEEYYIIQTRNTFYEWITEYRYCKNAYNKWINIKNKFDNKNLSGYPFDNNPSNHKEVHFRISLKNIVKYNIDITGFTKEELNKAYNTISLIDIKSTIQIYILCSMDMVPLESELSINYYIKETPSLYQKVDKYLSPVCKYYDISFEELLFFIYKLIYYNIKIKDNYNSCIF
jgi:hypothetical protein